MSYATVVVALLGLCGFALVQGETTSAVLEHQWSSGFKMNIRLQLLEKVTGGWTMTLRFTKPAPGLQIWRAKIVSVSRDKKVYELMNMPWNRDLPKCKVFKLALLANKTFQGTPAPTATVEFKRKRGDNKNLNEEACATTPAPTTTNPSPCTTPKPTTKTASPSSSLYGETTSAVLEHQWPWGFKMNIRLQLLDEVTGGWTMTLRFTKPSPGLLIWRAKIVSVSSDEKVYKLENMPWNRDLPKCKVFELAFRANKTLQGTPAPTATVELRRKKGDNTKLNEAACATTSPTPTTAPTPTTPPSPCTTPKPTTKTASPSSLLYGESTRAVLEHQWPWGFKMNIRLQLLEKVTGGWTMTLRFTKPAPGLLIWRAKIVSVSSDEKVYKLENMPWNRDLPKCKVFELALLANKTLQGTPAPNATVEFNRKKGDNTNLNETACATTPPPPTTTSP